MSDSPQPYRVLARKYRPRSFHELIGQDAMVQTLGNAIQRGRLAHAFLMTGVRGVGKTSTARLIAKALNCIGPDGQGGPTIDPCGVCEPCKAIAEGRHIDVIEMDAASHTGVDDVREIIEAVRYSAVSARYKVYIIDEVHMLSKNAFNALLKTLEEPPAHVKFLFATTEVNKVPVTVLSRCQRFDLRRIPAELLARHFSHVVEAENVVAEPDALALIAQAAEGSARDGLSILDQAIAHAEMGPDQKESAPLVTAAQVREMLGLSDRGSVRSLLGLLLEGQTAPLLTAVRDQYALGVDPLSLMRGLLELIHAVTLVKAGRDIATPGQSVEEREAIADWASQLGFAPLHRLWQLLLKGHDEVASAVLPIESCEMALLRVMHAATMPDPGEIARMLREGGPMASGAPIVPAETSSGPSASLPASFEELIEAFWQRGKGQLAQELHDCVGLVRYAPPELDYKAASSLAPDFTARLTPALREVTGVAWRVAQADGPAAPTRLEQEQRQAAEERAAILETPVVKAAMEAFPDADLDDRLEQWSA
ncbi:DNA polymerase-3 subunit gamma/tau [Sphingobium faniae]|nr:DNA polymerase-3 subunit gamma/tau [Sphingobium faniae]